jgi:hypothetical protein
MRKKQEKAEKKETKPKPVIKGKFVKGQSGNPNGRPKMEEEDREFFRTGFHRLSKKTLQRFEDILNDDAADPELQIRVGVEVLKRYLGTQSEGFSGEGDKASIVIIMGEDMSNV